MSQHEQIIISWLELRRIIGIIGIVHPVVLFVGGYFIFNTALQSSMSAYYYTGMRNVFVGLGFVTGVFLLSYKGYDTHDRIVSMIAGVMALIVAMFPCAPTINPTQQEIYVGYLHVITASIFLLALSYFCLVLFPKTGDKILTMKKRTRNKIYRICGIVIILSLVFTSFYFYPSPLQSLLAPFHPIYFGELIAFWAFGVAWLVKGKAILADDEDEKDE